MRKYVFAALALLLLLVVAAGLYYRAIQHDHHAMMAQAREIARQEAGLVEIAGIERFSGERAWYVVSGHDAEGNPLFVWVTDGEVKVESAANGITREEAERLTRQRKEDIGILRIVPGMLEGEPVWEVYYEMDENGKTRRYYDYYRFSDGTPVNTLRLNAE